VGIDVPVFVGADLECQPNVPLCQRIEVGRGVRGARGQEAREKQDETSSSRARSKRASFAHNVADEVRGRLNRAPSFVASHAIGMSATIRSSAMNHAGAGIMNAAAIPPRRKITPIAKANVTGRVAAIRYATSAPTSVPSACARNGPMKCRG